MIKSKVKDFDGDVVGIFGGIHEGEAVALLSGVGSENNTPELFAVLNQEQANNLIAVLNETFNKLEKSGGNYNEKFSD